MYKLLVSVCDQLRNSDPVRMMMNRQVHRSSVGIFDLMHLTITLYGV